MNRSKAFDKVWYDGLNLKQKLIKSYKLKQNSIKDKLLCLLIDFLKRVVLNGQFSLWTKVNAGVP